MKLKSKVTKNLLSSSVEKIKEPNMILEKILYLEAYQMSNMN